MQKSTLTSEIIGTLFGLSIFIAAAYGFYYYLDLLLDGINHHKEIIIFNKSAFSLLGISIGMLILLGFGSYVYYVKKEAPSALLDKIFSYAAIGALLLMFILPQIVSFFVHQHIDKIDYIVCEKKSTFKWNYTKYVYGKNLDSCVKYEK